MVAQPSGSRLGNEEGRLAQPWVGCHYDTYLMTFMETFGIPMSLSEKP